MPYDKAGLWSPAQGWGKAPTAEDSYDPAQHRQEIVSNALDFANANPLPSVPAPEAGTGAAMDMPAPVPTFKPMQSPNLPGGLGGRFGSTLARAPKDVGLQTTLGEMKQAFVQPWQNAVKPGGALNDIGQGFQKIVNNPSSLITPVAESVKSGTLRHDLTHPFGPSQTAKPGADLIQEMANPAIKLGQQLTYGTNKANQLEAKRRGAESPVAQAMAPEMNKAGEILSSWAGGEALSPIKALQALKVFNEAKPFTSLGLADASATGIQKLLGKAFTPGLRATLPKVAQTTAEKALGSVANAGIVNAGAETAKGMVLPDNPSDSTPAELGKGLRRWGGNQYNTAGWGAKALGFNDLGDNLIKEGQINNKGFESPHSQLHGWSDMLDPRYWAATMGENAPTSLLFMPLGLAGSTLASRVEAGLGAAGFKLGGFGTAVLHALGVGGMTAPLEAAMEASNSYEQVYKEDVAKGVSADQAASNARQTGQKTFWWNMALLGVTNAAEFATAFGGPMGKMLKGLGAETVAGKVGGTALMEGGQEMAQQAIQDAASGKKIDLFSPEYISQGAFGFITGGGTGLAGHMMSDPNEQAQNHIKAIQNHVFNNLPDELKAEVQQARADAHEQGVPQEQADQMILDKLTESDPRVQQLVVEGTQQQAKSAQDLMNHEKFSQFQQDALKGLSGQALEARKQTDPHGILENYNPLATPQQPVQPQQPQQQQTPSSRPQGPTQPFQQGETVRLAGMPGLHQIVNDQQGKKRDIIGPDGQKRSVPPQALQKFDTLAKGDSVNVAGREGVFKIADMRDGKSIRVTDEAGNAFHFKQSELTPSFSTGVQAAQQQAAPAAQTQAAEAPTAQQPQDSITSGHPHEGLQGQTQPPLNLPEHMTDSIGGHNLGLDQKEEDIDTSGKPADVWKKMREKFATSGALSPQYKVKLLNQMKEFAQQHGQENGFEFHPRHQELLDKFTAEAADNKQTKQDGKDKRTEQQKNDEEETNRIRRIMLNAAKQHATFDSFRDFYSGLPINSNQLGSQSRDSFLRDVYAEAHGEKPLAESNPHHGRVGETVTFEGPNGDKKTGTISKIIDDKLVGVDVPREDGKGTFPFKVHAEDISFASEQKPAAQATEPAVGDTVTLRGMGEQKFTVDAIKGNMLSLTSEKGGKLEVHKQAVVSVHQPAAQEQAPPTNNNAEISNATEPKAQRQPLKEQIKGEGGLKAGDRIKIRNGAGLVTLEINSVNEDGTYNADSYSGISSGGIGFRQIPFSKIEEVVSRAPELAFGDVITFTDPFDTKKDMQAAISGFSTTNSNVLVEFERKGTKIPYTVSVNSIKDVQKAEPDRSFGFELPVGANGPQAQADLSQMTGKELATEAESLRVPSWGTKDEVTKRIEKARQARAALGDKSAEDLKQLTVDELEKIMLDADMLPTENNQPRNKDNHIRRLVNWRDGTNVPAQENTTTNPDNIVVSVPPEEEAAQAWINDHNRDNWNPTHTFGGRPVEIKDIGYGIAYRYETAQPDQLHEWGWFLRKNDHQLSHLKPLSQEPAKQQEEGFTYHGNRVEVEGSTNRIVIHFKEKPTAEIREAMKAQQMRWHGQNQYWYGNNTPERMEFSKRIVRQSQTMNSLTAKQKDEIIETDRRLDRGEFPNDYTPQGFFIDENGSVLLRRSKPDGTMTGWRRLNSDGTLSDDGPKYKDVDEEKTIRITPESLLKAQEAPAQAAPQGDARAQEIADKLKELIRAGTEIKSSDLFRISDEVYKGSQARGTYSPKDAYDALELAMNQYLLEQKNMDLTARDAETVKDNVVKLAAIMDKLPTQTKRTEDQERFQQFSTPPSIAYIASWVANITNDDTVLEPSAGIGGLGVFAKANGAQVVANELDPRRLEVLKNMPFDQFYKEDGEQINNILPKTIKPTVVIMNPPFSTSATRGVTNTKNSFNHVDQALKRLEPGGRLVAILGLGREGNSKGFTEWINKVNERGNTVRAIVGIDGKNYAKYGTTYNVQYVVIDKANVEAETIKGHVDTLDKAIDLLGGVANERLTGNSTGESNAAESTGAASAGQTSTTRPNGSNNGRRDLPGPTSEVGNSGRGNQNEVGERGNTVQPTDEVREPADTTANDERANGVGSTVDDNTGNVEGNPADSSSEHTGSLGEQDDRAGDNSDGRNGLETTETKKKQKKPAELSDAIFEDYVPQKLNIKDTQKHPSQLAESAAMSAIELPDLHYSVHLPKEIVTSGTLSDAQLEAVAYAGQAHSQMLENGQRKGFFLGDGTGVGKGREISGIILDNFNQGRTKAVWVSLNDGLLGDSKSYWGALGGNPDDVFKKPKLGEQIKQKRGILYTTYSTLGKGFSADLNLQAQGMKVRQTRLDQLVEWLGPNFDGAIVFDEAHNMANAVDMKGARGIKKASQNALAGVDLQQRLPNARIVYASATGATEVSNLAYAERLGLWGTGTAFPSKFDFINKINAGGIAAMELVARDMKAMGVYIARNLSYNGVEYQKLVHNLTEAQTNIYDTLAHSWQIVLQNINQALEAIGAVKDGQTLSGNAKKNALGQFWSAQQRFFNQVLTALQMPKVITEAEKDLAAGKAIVMQLVNTNEASQDRQLAKLDEEEGELEDLDLTPRDILFQFLDKSFPVIQHEEYVDENGNLRSREAQDSEGNPIINQEALEMKETLMRELSSIKVPLGPLEIVLNHFGVDNVAEITGRSQRVVNVQDPETGRTKADLEKRSFHSKEADVDAFMQGKKNILMFSNAGGTGRSYHADNTKPNKNQRMHYLIQAGWEATKAVQGFGRTHRTNQASTPVYKLFSTNLKGQMRFVSSIARRLDQLGALTKGQRQTGSQGIFSAADNLESNIAVRALVQFYSSLAHDQISYLDKRDVLGKMGLADRILDSFGNFNANAQELTEVTKFLNRILTLESGLQNEVFDSFMGIVENMTRVATEDGTLDTGLENIKADSVKIKEEQDIRKDADTGSVTKYYQLDTGHKTVPVNLQNEMKRQNYIGTFQNQQSKSVRAFHESGNSTLANGNVVQRYFMQGPESSDYKYINEEELRRSKWEKLLTRDEAQEEMDHLVLEFFKFGSMSGTEAIQAAKEEIPTAEDVWQKALDELPEMKHDTVHMISGTLLPVWDRLPTDRVRVVRALTDDGQILLGRIISDNAIDQTLHNLGAEKRAQEIDTDTLGDKIMDGFTVHLANGWKFVRKRVSGDYRIELDQGTGDYLSRFDGELRGAGVFVERIGYDYRYFVPTGEEANNVIKELIKHRPVSELVPPADNVRDRQGFAEPATATPTEPVQAPATAAKPVTRSEIYKHIHKSFKVPIGTGRYRSRALGQYLRHINEIRSKTYGDFVVLAHELGHRLDNLYSFSKQPLLDAELMKLASTLQLKNGMTKAEIRAEGFAEFVRQYLYDPANAETEAPHTFAHFEDVLTQHRQLSAMRKLYDMLQTWHFQDARARVQGVTDLGGQKRSSLPLIGKLNDVIYEELGGIDRAINSVMGGRKNAPQGRNSPHHVAWAARGVAGRIKAFLHGGVTDKDGNIIGKSLEDILGKKSAPDQSLFRDYVMSLRALELHDQGRWKTPISIPDAQAIIKQVENAPDGQKYVNAAVALTEYLNNVTETLVDSGFLTEGDVDRWKDEHMYYVPFYRVMTESGEREGKAKGNGTGGKEMANLNNPVHGMKDEGSAKNIIDPFESSIKNTYLFLSLAARNNAGNALIDFLESTPNSASIAAIVPSKTKVTKFSLLEIADQLEQAGFDTNDQKVNLDKFAAVFRQTFTPDPTSRILNVWRNGHIVQVQIRDEALYNSYLMLDAAPVPALWRFLGLPNAILKAGVVLAPSFIPKNFERGLPTMLMQSDSFTTPKDYLDLFPMLAKNLYASFMKTDDYWKWMSSGGAHSTLNSISNTYLNDSSNSILRSSWKQRLARDAKTLGVGAVLRALRHISELGDNPIRMTEQQKALEKTGDPVLAAVRSRDVDVDFNKFGSGTRIMNAMNAFFNVSLQGHNRVYRTFRDHPYRTLIRGSLFLTLPTLLLYLKNRDDPEYWKLPQWERDLYWCIPTGMKGPLAFVKIPIPFEWGLLFKTLPERIFASGAGFGDKGGKAFDNLAQTALGVFVPTIIPTLIQPVLEWVTGKHMLNIFNTTDIVPTRLQHAAPEEQFKASTTEAAKGIGKLTGTSPLKVENAVTGYAGTLGKMALKGADELMNATGIKKRPPDPTGTWGLGMFGDQGLMAKSFFASPTSGSSAIMDDFYGKLGKLEEQQKGDPARKGRPIQELSNMRKTGSQLSAIRSMQEMIRSSMNTTANQKRNILDKMDLALNDLAASSMKQTPTDKTNMYQMRRYATIYIHNRTHPKLAQKFVDQITNK